MMETVCRPDAAAWAMTAALLNLAARGGFVEAEAFEACDMRTSAEQEAVRAELQRLVAEKQLRRDGARFLRARAE